MHPAGARVAFGRDANHRQPGTERRISASISPCSAWLPRDGDPWCADHPGVLGHAIEPPIDLAEPAEGGDQRALGAAGLALPSNLGHVDLTEQHGDVGPQVPGGCVVPGQRLP